MNVTFNEIIRYLNDSGIDHVSIVFQNENVIINRNNDNTWNTISLKIILHGNAYLKVHGKSLENCFETLKYSLTKIKKSCT